MPRRAGQVRRYGRTGAVALTAASLVVSGLGVASPASAAVTATPAGSASTWSVPFAGSLSIPGSLTTVRSVGVSALGGPGAVPRRATTTSLWANRSSIAAGQVVRLTGTTVVGGDRSRVRAQPLRLQVRSDVGWRTVGWRTLSGQGYVVYTVRPARSATYRLAFTGTGPLATSYSPAWRITVKPPASGTARAPVAAAAPASAAAPTAGTTNAKVATILATAAAQVGKWYRYGGAGPTYFDCSGLTQYVYKKVGIYLPHRANAQKGYGRAVSRAAARPGDLVVFLSGGYAYHVGIYAVGGYMYDAPHAGKQVAKRKIWGSNVIFRRLV